ncbi:MAG TPA: class I adenylate-forming enzyme family protein [Acidimicrobiales bacterium]|nr:class I adenylate-forming enzyme family protein [Acidimicrobiales bacterium]
MTPRPVAEIDAELTRPGSPYEVEVVDVAGVPTRSWRHAPRTLGEIVAASARFGDRDWLVYEGERTTFAEHADAVARLAGALVERYRLRRGERVAIAMRNLPEWSIAFWGITAAGGVAVALNAWWTADELAFGLADSGAAVLLADDERADRLADRLADLPDLRAAVVARPAGALRAGWDTFDELLAGARPAPLADPAIGPDDDATLFYTSGTTGRPKGVRGTHRNICTNPLSAAYVAARAAVRRGAEPLSPGAAPPQVYLLSVPLFHATGCHSLLVGHLFNGNRMVVMHRWDAGRALELIERERVTAFGGVPTMALQVLDHPDLARRDTSSVTSVRYGGAPAPPDLARRVQEAFGVPAMNGWGMTETSALSSMNVGDDYLARPDSIGVPVPVVEVRVVGADGVEVATGEVGELWVRGPNVVPGYWRRPEETAATFVDGWVRTGDLARVDGDGFLYVVDRAKDIVIRGGENVASVEVEGVLHAHPAVAEAAVVGVPHPTLGEEVAAIVSLLPGRDATAEELQAFTAERLARFKVPTRMVIRRAALPRNPAGKLMKRELRQEIADR